jgi:hypothetical protein
MGAVVHRAAGHGAVGAVLGAHMGRAAHRAADLHRRAGGDAAVARILHDGPGAVGLLRGAVDRHAVRVRSPCAPRRRRACRRRRRPRRVAVDRLALVARLLGMEEARLDVFVVHRDDAVLGRAVDREEVHPVMVLADLHAPARRRCWRRGGRRACRPRSARPRRRAPGPVALGHDDGVVHADRDGVKPRSPPEEDCASARLAESGAEEAGRDRGEAAHQEAAALHAGVHHLVEVRLSEVLHCGSSPCSKYGASV